ncbi:MAG: hypothetical protein H7A33_07100 [Deltaproteobacteria bacterium]|nr:hypothetical protein [Deltaproteobacteria bacterium]
MVDSINFIDDAGNTSIASSGSKSSVDQTKTQFLQLLLAQLQHQDPLSPADTDQMTAQMMALGQLEQLFDMNEKMESLVGLESNQTISNYSSLIGKKALSSGNVFEISDTDKGTINYAVAQLPEDTTIRVFDKFGNLVRQMKPTLDLPGYQEMKFDGKDNKGVDLASGYYTFTVQPLDAEGVLINNATYSQGTISAVRLESGQPILQMGTNDVSMADIEKIF